jgi:ssDNA-binding replication factor A large subunit
MNDELESRLGKLRAEFGGLIDDDTLRRIALDEGGMHMATEKKIVDFKDREEVSAVVKVTKIADVKNFTKRTGGSGKVRNLNVEDDSGSCRLTLWDEDVEMPEGLDIQIGTQLKISDCYVKQSDFGLDVSKGKKGKIEKL